MVTLKRISTWNNLKDSHKKVNILCVSFPSHCMGWNNFQGLGTKSYMLSWKTLSLWRMMRTLACTLCKWEMSLSSMWMISSWCAIIRISFWRWRKNFLESSKWKILGICISSLAWKWKEIMHNVFFTLTKLGISRRFSNAFAWRIAKPSECHLIPDKVEKECERGWWGGEGFLSASSGILDVCHVVYSTGSSIPNKHGESTHGKSKPQTLDCGQAHFSILARHFGIQITLHRIIAPRFGRILWCGLGQWPWG